MLQQVLIAALSCGVLAQLPVTPTPAEQTGTLALAPADIATEIEGAEGPALSLEGCPEDGILEPIAEPKPQYYLNFGSFPKTPLPGWTAVEEPGVSVPGVSLIGKLATPRYPGSTINGGDDGTCLVGEIFQTELVARGPEGLEMRFAVPDNTQYDVVMHFAENFILPEAPLQRIFDVTVNDANVVAQFNIVQSAGQFTPTTQTASSIIGQGGEIVVKFNPVSELPIINAIEVFPTGEYRTGGAGPAVSREAQLAAMFADFYSLLAENELVDDAAASAALGPAIAATV